MSPEKRRAYERRKRKVERNRKILGGFICVTLILTTVLVLSLTVFFRIDTITVKGKSSYDKSQIINASGISKGNNLFLCNLERASEGIRKNLPYISKAEVKRQLPSTIVIEITHSDAFIAVETKAGTALADKNGKVLEFVSREKLPSGIISLDAGTVFGAAIGDNIFELNAEDDSVKDQKKKAEVLRQIFDAVEKSGLKGITSIDIKSTSNINIMYQNRLKLNIGNVNDIVYKLKSAVEIIKKEDEIADDEKAVVYLSNPENVYVSPEK